MVLEEGYMLLDEELWPVGNFGIDSDVAPPNGELHNSDEMNQSLVGELVGRVVECEYCPEDQPEFALNV